MLFAEDTKRQNAAAYLIRLAESLELMGVRRNSQRPGAFFESLSAEKKELLSHLKSDDLKTVRWPPWK